jgi:DNA-binding NtrC family response regulator
MTSTITETWRERAQPIRFDGIRATVLRGPQEGAVFESDKPIVRIGASPDNDIVISDSAVSRHHVELQREHRRYLIVDLGSKNGTYLESARITEGAIRGAARIEIGATTLLVQPRQDVARPARYERTRISGLVGISSQMKKVFDLIEKSAPTDLPVLILGETGTGKDETARAVHAKGRRASQPFHTLDSAGIPASLIESTLFGHEKGAFTGADKVYAGMFERAHGGTLFLDEIGELPLELQPKLLRVLERGEIERIRGNCTIKTDVRLIAATNRNLAEMVRLGLFRADLYHRLKVIEIQLPPLRDRLQDLPLLIRDFFERFRRELEEHGSPARGVDPSALEALMSRPYPGNVRELINTLRRAALFAAEGQITCADLGADEPTPVRYGPIATAGDEGDELIGFKEAKARIVDGFERRYLQSLLIKHDHNLSRAARSAGIARRHLFRLVRKYGLVADGMLDAGD